MMGEATYNHVFADPEGSETTQRLMTLAAGGGSGALVPTPTGPSPARGVDTDDDEPIHVRFWSTAPVSTVHAPCFEGTDSRVRVLTWDVQGLSDARCSA